MFKIYYLFKTIKSIIEIFIITNLIFKKNKVIMFYFPIKAYQENILEIIKKLDKKKYLVLSAFNNSTSREIKNIKNSFFLDIAYLKYIPFKNLFLKNIDFFLSSYLTYIFPPNSKNVYISHDIYDAPMINKKLEKQMFIRINKIDYIFVASEVSKKYLLMKLREFNKKINPKLFNTGYLKLDHVYKKLKNNEFDEDSILLAPTLSSMLKNFNLDEYLDSIIKEILDKSEFKIIYRPHPRDMINTKKKLFINNIYNKYKDNKKFSLDYKTSYLDSYKRSKILITDFSGTAYTYAFSKLRPIIFFSKNENNLVDSKFNDLYFFKDRLKVGKIVQNIDNLKEEIYSVNKQIEFYSNQISLLRSERIKFFRNSIQQNILSLQNILNNEK